MAVVKNIIGEVARPWTLGPRYVPVCLLVFAYGNLYYLGNLYYFAL